MAEFSEAKFSEAETAEVLARLRDIHLPDLPEAGILADWAAGASLGLLAALLLTLLGGLVLRHLPSRRKDALAALAASRELVPAERLLAQMKILQGVALREARKRDSEAADEHWSVTVGRRLRSDFFATGPGAALHEDLYRREPRSDPEAIDRELASLLKRVGD